jgi:hypothetical protein
MSSPVTVQANKVWQLLTASSTANTYKQAIDVTWMILKQTAQLLWLVFCLVLVAGDWFWKQSIAAGQKTRTWVDNWGASPASPSSDPGETAAQMWQNFLVSSQSASQSLLARARQQLDLPLEPEATTPPVEPVAAPSPAPTMEPPTMKPPTVEPPTVKVEPLTD